VDSASSEESMKTANAELHKALADPELDDLPLLVLGNHQDKEGARTQEQVRRQIYTFRDHTAAGKTNYHCKTTLPPMKFIYRSV
jgi:hypothetical protein